MVDFNDLFNFTAADALAESQSKKSVFTGSGDLYRPSIKDEKCKDENYRALVRFIPFVYENKTRTMIERWECFLRDVNGENGIYVVSPKTNGKACPMRNLSYKLYTSDNAVDKANSKKINVYQQWYALIEVVKDVQHPDYEGKFFVYQFGKKIADKITEAMKGSEFKDPIHPFDFFNARLFEINLKKGEQKMDNGGPVANYDGCGFIEKTAPIHFGDGQTLEMSDDSKKAFLDWLENEAPKINNYQWKEWDVELTEKVNANLATYTSGYVAPRTTVAKAQETVNIISDAAPKKKSEPIVSKQVEVEVPSVEDESPVSEDDDAWINSVLNG